jgi:RNA polymerase sigma-70 factor (ECF subfamily)
LTKETLPREPWTMPLAPVRGTPLDDDATPDSHIRENRHAPGLCVAELHSGVVEHRGAVEALHRRYAGLLYSVCLRILRDRDQAQDAVQDAFLSAFRAMPNLGKDVKYWPWLVTIGTNASLKILRSQRRRPLVLDGETTSPICETDQASALAWRRALHVLVQSIDPRSQEILVCHHVLGMTQEEVADAMGISRRAVVKRLSSMRAKAVVASLAEALDD